MALNNIGSNLDSELGSDKRILDPFDFSGEIIQSFPPFETCEEMALDLLFYYGQFKDAWCIANSNADHFHAGYKYYECFLNNKLAQLPIRLYDSVFKDTNSIVIQSTVLNNEFINLDMTPLQISWNMLAMNIIKCELNNRRILELNRDKLHKSVIPMNYSLIPLSSSLYNSMYYQLVVKELENIYTGKNIS